MSSIFCRVMDLIGNSFGYTHAERHTKCQVSRRELSTETFFNEKYVIYTYLLDYSLVVVRRVLRDFATYFAEHLSKEVLVGVDLT